MALEARMPLSQTHLQPSVVTLVRREPCGGCVVTGQTYEARVWAIPTEPGPEVTAVRCGCCGAKWIRNYGFWLRGGSYMHGRAWRALIVDHSPLTDATGEVQP